MDGEASECNRLVSLFGSSDSSIKIKACLLKAQSKQIRERLPSSMMMDIQNNRKRSASDDWGWFEDVSEAADLERMEAEPMERSNSFTCGYKETPEYIIEESLSSQALWHDTAGRRPAQPQDERAYFQQLWEENFKHSEVKLTERTQESEYTGFGCKRVIFKGVSPVTSEVAKSFQCCECGTTAQIIIHIPKYRVIQESFDKHAEFLVVITLGLYTFGVWRRYTDFKKLSDKLVLPLIRDGYRNSLTRWQCISNQRRWYRCLDKKYLALKCFMLQRFLQDVVYESPHPSAIQQFLGIV